MMTYLIAHDDHLHQVPDVLGDDVASFLPPDGTRRRTIAVVGGGYSAATTLGNLLELAASRGHTYTLEIEWLVRKPTAVGAPYVHLRQIARPPDCTSARLHLRPIAPPPDCTSARLHLRQIAPLSDSDDL